MDRSNPASKRKEVSYLKGHLSPHRASCNSYLHLCSYCFLCLLQGKKLGTHASSGTGAPKVTSQALFLKCSCNPSWHFFITSLQHQPSRYSVKPLVTMFLLPESHSLRIQLRGLENSSFPPQLYRLPPRRAGILDGEKHKKDQSSSQGQNAFLLHLLAFAFWVSLTGVIRNLF